MGDLPNFTETVSIWYSHRHGRCSLRYILESLMVGTSILFQIPSTTNAARSIRLKFIFVIKLFIFFPTQPFLLCKNVVKG